ncbi:MAG: nucleotide exchange factor GrpE [Planctomycetes bacterium]|nr:nucleotide exchange factor GrpE [Planctomycetota bacterium]
MVRVDIQHPDNGDPGETDPPSHRITDKRSSSRADAGAADSAMPQDSQAREPVAETAGEVAALQDKIDSLENDLKRERASFINYRRRMDQEILKSTLAAQKLMIADVADLVDAFHHIDKGLRNHADFDALRDAYSILRGHFDSLLLKWQFEITGVPGEPFDPARHEAVMCLEDPSVDSPLVHEVLKPGFAVPGLVIRAAQVVVANPPPPQPPSADSPPSGTASVDAPGNEA